MKPPKRKKQHRFEPFVSGQDAVDSLQRERRTKGCEKLASINPERSLLVAGFLTKCASRAMSPEQILDATNKAVALHPLLAHEFEKCGFDINAPAGGGSAPDPSVPSRALMMGKPPAPARQPDPFQAVSKNPNRFQDMWKQLPDVKAANPINPVRNWGNAVKGMGHTALGSVARGAAGAWQGGARMLGRDPTAADTFAGEMDDVIGGGLTDIGAAANNVSAQEQGANTGQPGSAENRQMKTDELRESSPMSANIAQGAGQLGDAALQTAAGGSAMSKVIPGGASVMNASMPQVAKGVLGGANAAAIGVPLAEMLPTRGAEPAQQPTPVTPPGQPQQPPPTMEQPGQSQQPAPMPEQPGQPQPDMGVKTDVGPQQPEGPEDDPFAAAFAKGEAMNQQDPQGSAKLVEEAGNQGKGKYDSDPAIKAEVDTSMQTGQATEAVTEAGVKTLVDGGTPIEVAMSKFSEMELPEQIALALGLGAGVFGLVQAVTGGGMGSWLMAILGIATAGMMAGNAGMLGDTAQGFTQGLTDQGMGLVNKGMSLFGAGESGAQDSALSPEANNFLRTPEMRKVLMSAPPAVQQELMKKIM